MDSGVFVLMDLKENTVKSILMTVKIMTVKIILLVWMGLITTHAFAHLSTQASCVRRSWISVPRT